MAKKKKTETEPEPIIDGSTCTIPAHFIEEAKDAESNLYTAALEFEAADKQKKEAKAQFDKCQVAFNGACTNILHPEKADGFPDGTPMAGAGEGDEWDDNA